MSVDDFEKYIESYDVIEVIYPFSYDQKIYTKYGALLYYIEKDGDWNQDVYSGCIDLRLSGDEFFKNINKTKKINRAIDYYEFYKM